MMEMRKKKPSTAKGNAKKHRKKPDAGNTGADGNNTILLNSDKEVDKPLEQQESDSESPVIDKRRVQAIRRAIEEGDYKVDCNRTAEKLLQLEKDIWGNK